MTRRLIVVDVETSSLDTSTAAILEVAAIDVASGEEFYFVPHIDRDKFKDFDPEALRINRYFERGVYKHARSQINSESGWAYLWHILRGNTFAGSNPAFDSQLVARHTGTCWHHRLADLSAYAAAKLDYPLTELPGLDKVLEHLGIEVENRHSALDDARATAEAFRRLQEIKP